MRLKKNVSKNNKWDKHRMMMENRVDIIKQYKNHIAINLIAQQYGVTVATIARNLKSWSIGKRSGIKYLLAKYLEEI
jgi:uncharacterized protein YerC